MRWLVVTACLGAVFLAVVGEPRPLLLWLACDRWVVFKPRVARGEPEAK